MEQNAPRCFSVERVNPALQRKGYHCKNCRRYFTIRTGTIFEVSKIKLEIWLECIYNPAVNRKGTPSIEFAKSIGVTQKNSWVIWHRLREALKVSPNYKLRDVVEIDEVFMGGLEKIKHANKMLRAERGRVGKTPMIGFRKRGKRAEGRSVILTGMD